MAGALRLSPPGAISSLYRYFFKKYGAWPYTQDEGAEYPPQLGETSYSMEDVRWDNSACVGRVGDVFVVRGTLAVLRQLLVTDAVLAGREPQVLSFRADFVPDASRVAEALDASQLISSLGGEAVAPGRKQVRERPAPGEVVRAGAAA